MMAAAELVSAPAESTPVTMTTSNDRAECHTSTMQPRKLRCNDNEDEEVYDEDDDDHYHAPISGGPFDSTKRKSSWSATSLRKELGSPRMAGGGGGTEASNYEGFAQYKPTEQKHASDQKVVSDVKTYVGERPRSGATSRDSGATFLRELGSALVSCGGGADLVGSRGCAGSTKSGGLCGGVPRAAQSQKGKYASSTQGGQPKRNSLQSDLTNVVTSWVRLKNSINKAVQGDLNAAKEAWRQGTQPRNGNTTADHCGTINSVSSQDDSIVTYDYYTGQINRQQLAEQQEEEAQQQIRRLTSWGTVGTYETIETAGTADLDGLSYLNNGGGVVVEDDDGVPIDIGLLQTRSKKLQKAKGESKRRKRVVRFDYPPISSLRECPRTQPEQIRELFFTENELEQIEDDRYCTISADDVEIVAISTSTTADSEAADSTASNSIQNNKYPPLSKSPSSPQPCSHRRSPSAGTDANGDPSFRDYVSTPSKRKDSRKSRRTFSFDDVVNGRSVVGVVGGWKNNQQAGNSNASGSHDNMNSTGATTETTTKKGGSRRRRSSAAGSSGQSESPTASSAGSRRMIKSVQIYLRERSVG